MLYVNNITLQPPLLFLSLTILMVVWKFKATRLQNCYFVLVLLSSLATLFMARLI